MIKETRKALGWTQTRMGHELGLAAETICRMERGKQAVSLRTAQQIELLRIRHGLAKPDAA